MGLDDFRNDTGSGADYTVSYEIDTHPKPDAMDRDLDRTHGIFLGFIAGEGSFVISISKNGEDLPQVSPHFCLKVHEEDSSLLQYFQKTTGIGNLNYSDGRGHGRHIGWDVSSIDECIELIEWIDEYSEDTLFEHSSKYDSFLKWKACVDLIKKDQHKTREGILRIAEIRDDMNRDSRGRTAAEIRSMIDSNGLIH